MRTYKCDVCGKMVAGTAKVIRRPQTRGYTDSGKDVTVCPPCRQQIVEYVAQLHPLEVWQWAKNLASREGDTSEVAKVEA